MKILRHVVMLLIMAAAVPVQGRNIPVPKGYMFGFVASFNDSIVYFTDVQELDTIWVTEKKHMVAGRSNYSYQLRDYFAQKMDMPKRTCVVVGGTSRKKVQKKYEKMKKMYSSTKSKRHYDVRYLTQADFAFDPINMDDDQQAEKPAKEKEKKKGHITKTQGKPLKDGHMDGHIKGKRNPR